MAAPLRKEVVYAPRAHFARVDRQTLPQQSPGTHVPRAGASSPLDCPTGRFSMSTGAEICDTCPSGRYNDETRQSECKTCQKGRFMELSYAVTGKEVRCQDCPCGTYYDLPGSNSSQNCKPTPSGFFATCSGKQTVSRESFQVDRQRIAKNVKKDFYAQQEQMSILIR